MPLSAIIITFNEETNLERCLRSISWVDEIIVVDSFSTDRTLEIARRYTRHVIQHRYEGDIPQREIGFRAAAGDWLMYIDADEEVTDQLRHQITDVLRSPGAKPGYAFLRKSRIFGTWTEHGGWFPDYTFRLFRKDAYVAEPAEVHGGFTVKGERGVLEGLLLHYTYPSIHRYLSKMNDYTSLAVHNKLMGDGVGNIGFVKIVLSPFSEFFRKFFSNK
ncbi:MAG TPA: glycosyltransferase family 2 protein, partial [Bacteroidota bacterium]|nr:glycosyltransferase family 2 protein [Bacteroidota bacterium]